MISTGDHPLTTPAATLPSMPDDPTDESACTDHSPGPEFTTYRPDTTDRSLSSRPETAPVASPALNPDDHALATLDSGSELTHDRGLGSQIRTGGSDGLAPRKERLHRFARIEDATAETLRHLLPEVQRITTAVGLPRQVGERGCRLVRQYQLDAAFTGASLEEWAGAFVYTAAREVDVYCPRSRLIDVMKCPEEQSDRSMQAKLSGCYSRIQTVLDLSIAPVAPDEQVPPVAARVDGVVPADTVREASVIARRYMDAGNSGTPTGIAAAALVVAGRAEGTDSVDCARESPTIAAFASAADVEPRTVYRHRDAMHELEVVSGVSPPNSGTGNAGEAVQQGGKEGVSDGGRRVSRL